MLFLVMGIVKRYVLMRRMRDIRFRIIGFSLFRWVWGVRRLMLGIG